MNNDRNNFVELTADGVKTVSHHNVVLLLT